MGDTWQLKDSVGQDVPPSEIFREFERSGPSDASLADRRAVARGGERRPARPTLLTVNRLGGWPTAEPFLEWLRGWPVRPARVIHFEPCWLPRRYGAEGARRNRWIVRRDGCRDLVMLLQSAHDIVMERGELDCVTSSSGRAFHLLVWQFVDSRDGDQYTEGTSGFKSSSEAYGGAAGVL